jgi:electron transfer flavoprotein beta subunit
MRIAVCIKQVPDTEARLRVRADGRWIEEEDVPFVINESDEFALEEAIALAEKTGGEVVVFTIGPARAAEALRKALALGAARGVHLSHPDFQRGDATSNGLALARAVAREECAIVFTGSSSDDLAHGATATVLASTLGWPHAWLVMGFELEEGGKSCRVVREMESGKNELLRIQLPAVIEVQAGINHPRYASLKGIMAAKKKPIGEVAPGDLGLDAAVVGAAGAVVEVVAVRAPSSGAGAEILPGDPAAAAKALVEKLRNEARVL